MGTILTSFYQKAAEKGGLNAQIKLAMITKISSKKADEMADTPENIKIFDDALKSIEQ